MMRTLSQSCGFKQFALPVRFSAQPLMDYTNPTDLDGPTTAYYRRNTQAVFEQYEPFAGAQRTNFQKAFPTPGKILEIGCTGGRDVDLLLRLGHDAYGMEPLPEFRAVGIAKRPHLKDRLFPGSIPYGVDPAMAGQYDGVLCSSVLMHLDKTQIEPAIQSFKRLLKPGGRVYIDVPTNRIDLDTNNRDKNGRLYTPLKSEDVRTLFEKTGFQLLSEWSWPSNTAPNAWWNQIYVV